MAERLRQRRRAHLKLGDDRADAGAHRLVAQEPEPSRELAPYRDAGVFQHAMIEDQALLLAVLADIADGEIVDRFGDRADAARLTVDAQLAGGDAAPAEDALGEFRAAGADETVEADDLALAQLEVDAGMAERGGDAA